MLPTVNDYLLKNKWREEYEILIDGKKKSILIILGSNSALPLPSHFNMAPLNVNFPSKEYIRQSHVEM